MNKGRQNRHSRTKRGIAMLLVTALLCSVSFLHVSASEEDAEAVAEGSGSAAEISEKAQESFSGNGNQTKVEADKDEEETEEDTKSADTAEQATEETEGETEGADTDSAAASPVKVRLAKAADTSTAPEHHKYIKCNGEDDYTLTLNVKGMYDSETSKPKVDVLLIVDKSGSMEDYMRSGNSWQTRMNVLKSIVTGTGGLSQAILQNNQIDGQMAVVTYSGWQDGGIYNDAWTTQSWTASKSTLDRSVNGITIGGGTNSGAGLYTGAQVLKNARTDAKKIVIFLSDGDCGFYYNAQGYTTGSGNGRNVNAENYAKEQAGEITGLDAFYTVGIVSANTSSNSTMVSFLKALKDCPKAVNKGYYSASDKDGLVEVFDSIIAEVTEYTCRNVTITDTLSAYVELKNASDINPVILVTDADGGEVTTVTVTNTDGTAQTVKVEDLITVSYNSDTRTVTAAFRDGYILEKNYTYSVSFDVKPTQKAYDDYAASGYGDTVGSENSDAPGNTTSSGEAGFYSNEDAVLTYTYGKEDAASRTAAYAERPVIQVSALTIPVEKIWKNTDDNEKQEITVNLYQDGGAAVYKTLTLKADSSDSGKNWKGSFTSVAKGHTYTVREVELDGFVSEVSANDSADVTKGFTVTNTKLPELTITKTVEGKMGDKTKAFTFEITLEDKDGNPISGTFSYTGISVVDDVTAPGGGTLTFAPAGEQVGKAAVSLKHGQGIVITKLPPGSTYTVKETDAGGYTVTYAVNGTEVSGKAGEEATEAAGTLNVDTVVNVTNTLDSVPVTGIVTKTTWIGLLSALLLALAAAEAWIVLRRRRR